MVRFWRPLAPRPDTRVSRRGGMMMTTYRGQGLSCQASASGRQMRRLGRFKAAALAALIAVLASGDLAAQNIEQAQANCKERLRPAVQACVQRLVKEMGGPWQKYLDGCRQSQAGAFRNCVTGIMAKTAPERPAQPAGAQEPAVDLSKVELSRTPGLARRHAPSPISPPFSTRKSPTLRR